MQPWTDINITLTGPDIKWTLSCHLPSVWSLCVVYGMCDWMGVLIMFLTYNCCCVDALPTKRCEFCSILFAACPASGTLNQVAILKLNHTVCPIGESLTLTTSCCVIHVSVGNFTGQSMWYIGETEISSWGPMDHIYQILTSYKSIIVCYKYKNIYSASVLRNFSRHILRCDRGGVIFFT